MFTFRKMGRGRSAGDYWLDTMSEGFSKYYLEAHGEPPGTWLHLHASTAAEPGAAALDGGADQMAADPDQIDRIPSDRLVAAHGGVIEADEFRNLLEGKTADGKETLVKPGKNGHVAGIDLQYAPPKSVSVLRELARQAGDENLARALDEAIEAAAAGGLKYGLDHGAFVGRRSVCGALNWVRATEIFGAAFVHSTSREGDPQGHVHHTIMNMVRRPDGSVGALNEAGLLRWKLAMSRQADACLAGALVGLGLAVDVGEDGRWSVSGINQDLIDTWSKRRAQVEERAAQAGRDYGTDADALATRRAKAEVGGDLEACQTRWIEETRALGLDPAGEIARAREIGAQRSAARAGEGLADLRLPSSWNEDELARAGLTRADVEDEFRARTGWLDAAVAAAFERESVVSEADLHAAVWSSAIHHPSVLSSPAAVPSILEERIRMGDLLVVSEADDRESMRRLSTPGIAQREVSMMATIAARTHDPRRVPEQVVDQVLSKYPTATDEQREAVRWACAGGMVSVVEGAAGSGKSFSTAMIKEAYRLAGCDKIVGAAPSDAALRVLREDANFGEAEAFTVQMIATRWRAGENLIPPGGVLIVDEAGMVSTSDMAAVIAAADAAQAKVILSGDSRQLNNPSAGCALDLVIDEVGSSRINAIRRQQDPEQRRCSEMFADPKTSRLAMERYDELGKVVWAKDRAAGLAQLVEDWRAYTETHPASDAVVIATKNSDVRQINAALREILRSRGEVWGADHEIEVMDKAGRRQVIEVAAGDQIVFGEKVRLADGRVVRNGTGAKVLAIADDGRNTLIKLRFEDGYEWQGEMSQLAGFRDSKNDGIPKFNLAYASTVYGSQGRTVKQTFAYVDSGMTQRNAYVAGTRHKDDIRWYVDCDHVRDLLWQKQPQGEPRDFDDAEVKAHVFSAASKVDRKTNYLDFVDPIKKRRLIEGARVFDPAEAARRETEILGRLPHGRVEPAPAGLTAEQTAGVQALARRLQEVAANQNKLTDYQIELAGDQIGPTMM